MQFRLENGSLWEMTEDQSAMLTAKFPRLDVAQECRHAAAWLEANPTRRKTARGMMRFLVSWMIREMRHVAARQRTSGPSQGNLCPHDVPCRTISECRALIFRR